MHDEYDRRPRSVALLEMPELRPLADEAQPQNNRHHEMRHLRKHYAANRKRLAQMRAAKERKRMERVARDEPMPDVSHTSWPRYRPSGFRVTVECLDDGKRASFTAHRLPWGLSVSPTAAGRKVAAVLSNYNP